MKKLFFILSIFLLLVVSVCTTSYTQAGDGVGEVLQNESFITDC